MFTWDYPGIEARLWTSPKFGLEAALAFHTPQFGEIVEQRTALDFTMLFPIAKREKIDLNLVTGLGILARNNIGNVQNSKKNYAVIYAGLSPEWRVFEYLSLEINFGFSMGAPVPLMNRGASPMFIRGIDPKSAFGLGAHFYF
jgi:hypothetical protein